MSKPLYLPINLKNDNDKCTESHENILNKINTGVYKLAKKKKRSSVWNVYREIVRPGGSKLKYKYFCMGCKRVMQSTGGTTSNLRVHKCHVQYLKDHSSLHTSPQVRYYGENFTELYVDEDYDDDEIENDIDNGNGKGYETFETAVCNSPPLPASEHAVSIDVTSSSSHYNQHDEQPDIESEHESPDELDDDADADDVGDGANERPLFKFFADESWSADMANEQTIEIDHELIEKPSPSRDFHQETIKPSNVATKIDANAISEAESYAKAWAHSFLKLNDEQKFFAKRSIDELLVLGRLQRLSLCTVTSLTTNL